MWTIFTIGKKEERLPETRGSRAGIETENEFEQHFDTVCVTP
jgi:hypothetical protein